MQTSIIVAVAKNFCIGQNNQLPWHLPEDLKFFKRTTMGKPVIMGRNTYESIGFALPGRLNIIISSQAAHFSKQEKPHDNVLWVSSIEEALRQSELALDDKSTESEAEVFIIGGAKIYSQMLDKVDRLYLTRVDKVVEGDAFFPEPDWQQWQLLEKQSFAADEKNAHAMVFEIYKAV